MSDKIVLIIVFVIIALQIYFFIKNVLRMQEYKKIFKDEKSWKVDHDSETKFVKGIKGKGNKVFVSIKDSINKYLGNNSGSVIEFSLLKDAVDRHCDSVENDINTLTPVPLYCGLAGTMAGVIVGLTSLLSTGSITALLSSGQTGDTSFSAAATGVNDLLGGVAWAMLASICGIFLTTVGSILFKRYKLQGEAGKNTFLAWLQAKLLPELPSDTSDALNNLVRNLNRFNDTFATNTSELRGALTQVNESYRIQGDIIKAVHDMDVMKMAKANVRVLQELKDCTDKLEKFNEYLDSVHGYTDAIHLFTTKLERESDRLYVLEEIKNFFTRHKAELAKDTADVDKALRDALTEIKESAGRNSSELNSTLVQQAEQFKQILNEEKESFQAANSEIRAQFGAELSQMPMLERRLSAIADIPSQLEMLINRIEQSNANLATNVSSSLSKAVKGIGSANDRSTSSVGGSFSPWMKWVMIIALIVIAIACGINACHNIFHQSPIAENSNCVDTPMVEAIEVYDTTSVVIPKDTITLIP